MKTPPIPCAIAHLLAPVESARLDAGNVRAVQRVGSELVDIDYDVTGTSTPGTCFICVKVATSL